MATEKSDRLLNQLNGTGLQQKDFPLYQVIKELIRRLKELQGLIASGSGGGGGSSVITNNTINQFLSSFEADSGFSDFEMVGFPIPNSSSTPGITTDYVVASDGALPTPLPIDDGFGNFIYVPYTP